MNLRKWAKTGKSDRPPSNAITLLNHVLSLTVRSGTDAHEGNLLSSPLTWRSLSLYILIGKTPFLPGVCTPKLGEEQLAPKNLAVQRLSGEHISTSPPQRGSYKPFTMVHDACDEDPPGPRLRSRRGERSSPPRSRLVYVAKRRK